MTDSSIKPNWQKLIDAANRSDIEDSVSPTRPATDDEIDSLRRRAAQKGLGIDEDFMTFLRYANGIGFNGMTIPSAETNPGYHDFVIYNDKTSFIELGPVYGNVDDTYYVLYPDGKFRCLSGGDPDYVLSTHDTFFEMLTDALLQAVGPTVKDSDPAAAIYGSLPTTA